ncbi:hypothetical protein [Mycobacterium sp. 23]|uniref:hypothetical protein n=1 Tax=Mycobacterium sp. 23 TaxID=3400424 RepID=UPI003AADF3B4
MAPLSLLPQLTEKDVAVIEAAKADTSMPSVGDLWMVAWDGEELGLALIAAVRQGYVLIWPVTDVHLAASAPCFRLQVDGLAADFNVWPEAEAGVSNALLSHRIRPMTISDKVIRGLHTAIRGEGDIPSGVELVGARDDATSEDALATVCDFVVALSDIEWTEPRIGRSPFSPDALVEQGITMREIATQTSVAPASARALFDGKRVVPADLVLAIARRHDVAPGSLIGPLAGIEVAAIDHPRHKAQIVELAARRHVDEATSRAEVWEAAQRAARISSRDVSVEARVDQAVQDLLNEDPPLQQ